MLALLLVSALALRLFALDRIPGVIGDEAGNGVQSAGLRYGMFDEWQHPTGRPRCNPLFLAPQLLMHLVMAPDFRVLRLPAVLADIATVALFWRLWRPLLGTETALVAVLIMASLPVNLAYARLGWDPGQLGLVAVLTLWAAWQRKYGWLAAGLLLGLLVHPLAVFLVPAAAGCMVMPRGTDARRWLRSGRLLLLLAAAGAAALAALRMTRSDFLPSAAQVLARAADLPQEVVFFAWWVRLFTGTTVYRHLVDRALTGEPWWLLLLGGAFAAAVVGLAARRWWRARRGAELGLLAGLAAALTALYLAAGLPAVLPPTERYAVFSVFPVVLLMTLAAATLAGGTPVARRRLLLLACLLGAVWQGSFALQYFGGITAGTGNPLPPYRTAGCEPKVRAFRQIMASAKGRPAAVILTEGWDLWMPLRYLAAGEPRVTVTNLCDEVDDLRHAPNVAERADFTVVFAGERVDQALRPALAVRGYTRACVPDAAGRELLAIYSRR